MTNTRRVLAYLQRATSPQEATEIALALHMDVLAVRKALQRLAGKRHIHVAETRSHSEGSPINRYAAGRRPEYAERNDRGYMTLRAMQRIAAEQGRLYA